VDRRTVWLPPGYTVLLVGPFALFGATLATMRLVSLASGVLVLALTWRLARRDGGTLLAATLGVALVAVDGLFLRGSLVGRMDVPVLAPILLAGLARGRTLRVAAAAGALLLHPVGVAALVPLVARRDLRGVGGAVAASLGLWLLAAGFDPALLLEQIGGQLVRKGARPPLEAVPWPRVGVAVLATVGLARRDPGLAGIQATLLLAVLAGQEMWYAALLAPLTAVGLVRLGSGIVAPGLHVRAGAVGAIALGLLFAGSQVARGVTLHRDAPGLAEDAGAFEAWCDRLDRLLPEGAVVLLASAPDPWFGLRGRSGRTLRHAVPGGFPADRDAWLRAADVLVVGDPPTDPALVAWVRDHGRAAETVPAPGGTTVRIVRRRDGAETGPRVSR
jgi:hypothetical protein